MAVKYVFVTGGVVSGLGKGITAASLGRLLKARGYQVTMQKFDPYILCSTTKRRPEQVPRGENSPAVPFLTPLSVIFHIKYGLL